MSIANLDLFDVTHRSHRHGVLGVIGDPLLSGGDKRRLRRVAFGQAFGVRESFLCDFAGVHFEC